MFNHKNYMIEALHCGSASVAERGKVGIVAALKDGTEVGDHNHVPRLMKNKKCEFDDIDKTKPEVLHAEEALVAQCCNTGKSLVGATVYITRTPCKNCAAILAEAGITRLFWFSEHPHGDGLPVLEECGVECHQLNFPQDIIQEKYL